ncbi:glutathione S-transferase family protein [Sphingomonas oligophenolica]|uniref:Glutathione S-transferase family protein n=1 Tax=Sphingomonas oligophenolica TaxID=301154 RepID=A0A502CLC2_9SPHN|nr:glutathione S-transferase family protein [Sphingomonas oligophenolica]TPG12491.1 glutathione S-transferase family protein [Sphingomonas oligophenolica]
MLFYDSAMPAPNPRRVRIFLAEKGIRVPMAQVSIPAGEHKGDAYLAVNPLGQTPALALDDQSVLTESVAICRYFEALHPDPPLFGFGAQNIAAVDMWTRRIELRLMTPLAMVWVHTHPYTARVVAHQYKDFGESQRPRVVAAMREFDAALDHRNWLDGERYTIADIVLLTTIDFAAFVGVPMPDGAPHLKAWHDRATARPSAQS